MAKARTREAEPSAAERKALEAAIDALVHGDHGDPFGLLGMHEGAPEGPLVVRSFQPHARAVWAVDADTGESFELPRVHPAGFFAGAIADRSERFRHRLRLDLGSETVDIDDPYRFPALLGEMDAYLFTEGNYLDIYQRFGAHPTTIEGVDGVGFVVWAPSARRVSVVGPFNAWDGRRLPMRRRVECGAWELFVPGLGQGAVYKYEVKGPRGELLPLKADPFAFAAEKPPATASVVHGCPRPAMDDNGWMQARGALQARDRPISIYEVHLGSWMRVVEDGHRYLSYHELADRLVPYVEAMGFTHVELLPVSEYPFDGSWGYQPIGLYAPTSRFGSPEDFAHLIERFHQKGIGVLIDWVPGHFPSDAHGLAYFDGTHLFEHEDPRQGFHLDWNTLIYNYGRNEVRNFLTANALFWLDRYHIDGLRVDAVASMLYLDYSRKEGGWVPNRFGGRENLEAIDFMRRTNELVYGRHEGAITVAEESTAWPAVSQPVYLGGLGFGYKWNMGWMHDTLQYMQTDPLYRRYRHHEMTFGLLYAFSENFVLPLSHDEVVHGKGSLLGKMPGDRWQRFANLRAYYGFMWTHPGKKLLFMGGEIAQEREWNHDASLDWHLLADPMHAGVQQLIRDLNGLYRSTPGLFERDCESEGFEWIDGGDADNSVLTFLRKGRDPERPVVVACNFTPVVRHGYRVGVPLAGAYKERLNTDAALYGGSNVGNAGGVVAEPVPRHGREHSLALTLPPLATLILERAPN